MIATKEPHVHKFKPKRTKVLLHKYENIEGKPEDVALTGYDVLKQFVCDCGKTETYDLIRTLTT